MSCGQRRRLARLAPRMRREGTGKRKMNLIYSRLKNLETLWYHSRMNNDTWKQSLQPPKFVSDKLEIVFLNWGSSRPVTDGMVGM